VTARGLTKGERELAFSMFRGAIHYDDVQVKREKWFPFQPANILMAPCGHLHVHPQSPLWSEDYSRERLGLQALFLHEMTHVWQSQLRGKYYLPLMRHPFCHYDYKLVPGRPYERYGLEQQAEIVRHAFLARLGAPANGAPPAAALEALLPFGP
jgi:hypothetical protein